MSIARIAWAKEQTTGSLTRKAVLIALADHENGHTGKCCPKIETLAAELECSDRTVERALLDLADQGLIVRERSRRGDGSLGVYHYAFPTDRSSLPDSETGGPPDNEAEATRQSDGSRGTGSEPETNLEPNTGVAVRSDPRSVVMITSRAWKVDRQLVSDEHARLSKSVLSHWNEQAGQALASKDWLAKIVMRIREHPELTADDHADIIRGALADPWWKGPPSPAVVYGNGALFEQTMAKRGARAPAEEAYDIAQAAIDRARRAS